MPLIRILLTEAAPELRAVVHEMLADQSDLIVIGNVSGEMDVLLQAGKADVVVVGMIGAALPPVAERLVDEYPRIGVLALDIGHEQGLLYQLRPHVDVITALTPLGLVTAIRQAAVNQAA